MTSRLLARFGLRRIPHSVSFAVGVVSLVVAVVLLARALDPDDLATSARAMTGAPISVVVALAAFGLAFVIRAGLWVRVLPGLSFGHALAGINLALGANHVLPLRLGEPMRIVSVVRRTDTSFEAATASTVTLRAADILSVAVVGVVLGPTLFARLVGPWGVAIFAVVLAIGVAGFVWLRRVSLRTGRSDGSRTIRLPGPIVAIGSMAAWLLEAVLVWQCAHFAGLDVSFPDAVLVTTVAVAAQTVAIAPSGLGTYEAASVAAYAALGFDAGPALAAAITAHALKTLYSLVAGGIAVFRPTPSLLGHLRLPAENAAIIASAGPAHVVGSTGAAHTPVGGVAAPANLRRAAVAATSVRPATPAPASASASRLVAEVAGDDRTSDAEPTPRPFAAGTSDETTPMSAPSAAGSGLGSGPVAAMAGDDRTSAGQRAPRPVAAGTSDETTPTLDAVLSGAPRASTDGPAPDAAPGVRNGSAADRAPVDPADDRPPVVLFLPAHDEEASVADVVRRVPAEVHGHPVTCLVIDDGSTDATAERAAAAGATVVPMGTNQGLGAAVRRGLREGTELGAAAVVFCDADGEYAPEELATMVEPILAGEADYVVGSRFGGTIEHMRPHRRFGNIVLTKALCFVARRRISDGQSGYRALSPRAAADAEIVHDFNYAQVLTLDLLAKGFRYAEVPITYRFRTEGQSFIRLGRYLRAVTPAIYRELNQPSVRTDPEVALARS